MESQEHFTNTLSYIATCISMLCGGTTSLFATYGSSFSEILGFSQYETNLVASLGDYAHYMSAPLFGYLSSRIGPTRVIQFAGVLMFLGYMGLSHAFRYFDTPNEDGQHYVAIMSMLFALVGVGSKAAYMSSMATTARNFKQSRYSGIALGVPLSLYGLSTFVFSSVKAGWFEKDSTPERYLAFMAITSGVVHLIASCFVTLKDVSETIIVEAARRRSRSAAKQSVEPDQSVGREVPLSAEAIEMTEPRRRRMTASASTDVDTDVAADQTDVTVDPLPLLDGDASHKPLSLNLSPDVMLPLQAESENPPLARSHTALLLGRFCRDPTAWVLLLGLICFSGPGLMFVNNCGTMVRAMSHTTTLSEEQIGQYKDKIVATQSFFSFSSRLMVGYLSDIWRTRLRLPRSGLLILAGMLMIYAQNTAAQVRSLEDLYTLSILIGVSMGSVFTLAPTITSETWGAENFGICWGIITLGPAIGGHVCNLIFGFNWDEGQLHIATRMGSETPQNPVQCDRECFIPAFLTTAKIAYLGLIFFAATMCMPRATAMWKTKR
ncbi:MFS general substrate transporter [Coemansia reversa NRRL 1564]|uniref:MFS general substrate transporter n=1 Tax=Coemansia reversa (strain ATCC 12441 / NRRL 1564) TaxID=763665 RepID=A0A2G5BEY6_COERN|nr:MFS general substrate transporter [Coemansia reversa NRRL 1564]|eukprot:PIA17561.1 MFS general substrate transporter [Coemansia reversa NRRL 1564]